VKKECDEIIAGKKSVKSSSTTASNMGQLYHTTEDLFADAESDEVFDMEPNGNDSNEDALLYFVRLSKHYLRVVKSSSTQMADRHPMSYPVIADSGVNYHMFWEREFFSNLSPATGQVILGDGKTSLAIKGVGTVTCKMGSNIVEIPNVRYVPELSESIYSLHIHIKTPNHGLESSYEKGLFVNFPHFQSKAIIGKNDIYLDMVPFSVAPCDKLLLRKLSTSNSSEFCRNMMQLTSDIKVETDKIDNILQDLRSYYSTIKTKRQLGLNVPAGFHQDSSLQQQFKIHSPPRKSSTICSTTNDTTNVIASVGEIDADNLRVNEIGEVNDTHPITLTNQSSTPLYIPLVRSVDKPSSSLPQHITMTEDYLRSCVGFQKVDTIKKYLSVLYHNTIKLDHTPADAVLDPGCFATLQKKNRNTTPVPRPSAFSDIIHVDIIFGPEVSVGNVHYGLICVDRHSHMTYIYSLQNLTTDIQKQLELFFSHIVMVPR
jgi:hypothetical protein